MIRLRDARRREAARKRAIASLVASHPGEYISFLREEVAAEMGLQRIHDAWFRRTYGEATIRG